MKKTIFLFLLLLYPVLSSHATSEQWGWMPYTHQAAIGGGNCHYCDPAFENGDCTGFYWHENRIVGANYVQNSPWDNWEYLYYPNWGRQAFCKVQFQFAASEGEFHDLIECLSQLYPSNVETIEGWFEAVDQDISGKDIIDAYIPTSGTLFEAAVIALCFTDFNLCAVNRCVVGPYEFYNRCCYAKRFIDVDQTPWRLWDVY